MKKLISSLKWLDNNLVKIVIVLFIYFIPLWPKFPLKPIGYTYIAVRLDDVFVALTAVVFFIQWVRKKLTLPRNFFILILLFWIAVFISLIYNLEFTKFLPYKELALLNALRRIQYMFVFFMAIGSVKSKDDFYFYLKNILMVIFIVTVYGIGQKFLGWPAVQTMNPEYSRGHLLILTPEARISSTFGGHYDLAAFLIFLLPVIYGYYFYRNKLIYFLLFTLSLFAMILTASRVSFGAYLVSLLGFLLFLRKFKHFALVIVLTGLFVFMNNNLTSRISRTFQIKQIFVNEKTGQVVIPQKITSKELPAGTLYVRVPIQSGGAGSVSTSQTAANEVLVTKKLIEDIKWEASRSGKTLTTDQAAIIAATISASLKPIYTVVSDISLATRLQVEWPRAILAFLRNPILGTGPSSITEATDNDYLRWLGEFGLLGTGIFVFILYLIGRSIWRKAKQEQRREKFIYYGFIFGFGGLLLNAGWIDVFEASKVAYIFWLMAGLFLASFNLRKK